VKIDALITSEYGNGILFDRSVHGGSGGARATLKEVATKYLTDHPGAKLDDEGVRAEIEAVYIAAIEGEEAFAGRCANIKALSSPERGSYVE
ncbi:MAG TPA: hypothetical protein VGG33_06655, partial [Polyangia bacterium]